MKNIRFLNLQNNHDPVFQDQFQSAEILWLKKNVLIGILEFHFEEFSNSKMFRNFIIIWQNEMKIFSKY